MSYWQKTLETRISRRRALASGGAAAGMLALSLAGCGGGDDGDSEGGTSGLLFQPVDTSKEAVKGGVMQSYMGGGVESFDQVTGNFATQAHTDHVYSRLVRFKVGSIEKAPTGESEPDIATSWEMSPDGLQWTFKVRQGMKFDSRAPTNGRNLSTDDIKYSWDRFASLSTSRSQLVNAVEKNAPVTGVTFPDASTAVFKLAFPFGAFLHSIGYSWHFAVMPVEAADKFDVRQEMRGTGPWMLTKYEPSVSWEYQRNPNWWGAADRPFLDGIRYALISESATQQAQFKAGNLWAYGAPQTATSPPADLVLTMKRENPDIQMQAVDPFQGNGSYNLLGFSKLAESPWFTDSRLRQAVSMLLDRDAWIDVFYNVSGFEREGVPVEVGWHAHVPASWSTLWIDPKGKGLGDAAKYFQHNPDEAAKLLRAADKFGWEQPYTYHAPGTGGFGGDTLVKQNEVITQMLQEGGHFKLKIATPNYVNEFRPNWLWNLGKYEGICGNHPLGGWPDWDLALWSGYTPGSRNDWVRVELPVIYDLMVQHRRESDDKKKYSLMETWQKELAKEMWVIPHPGIASTFALQQPWLGNGGYFNSWTGGGAAAERNIHLWYDKAKDKRAA
jgi:ABC-type transport system substrate-binding protein